MKKSMIILALILLAIGLLAGFRLIRRSLVSKRPAKTAQNNTVIPNSPANNPDGAAKTNCAGNGSVKSTYAYASIPGVDANLLSLDVYIPKLDAPCPEKLPLMIYVHGGGWQIGDKAGQIKNKATYFPSKGYVFVSVNYRLAPAAMYPVFNQDVAAAVKYVYDNADKFNADKDKIAIMGHSAGGGIISAISTDEKYLNDVGLPLNTLKCAVSLDTEGYDVSRKAAENTRIYKPAFGTDESTWTGASPINHISAGKGIPSFFIVTRGNKQRVDGTNDFKDKLTSSGVYAEILETPKLDHEGVNAAVGADSLITPQLQNFLNANCS